MPLPLLKSRFILLVLVSLSGLLVFTQPVEAKTKKPAQRSAAHRVTQRVPAPALNTFSSGRYADLIIDAGSGKILHEQNADAPRHPASLTKMMTLYVLFQALDAQRLRLTTPLPVSSLAAGQSPTKLGLRAGDSIQTEDAILGLVTESANDAAVVIAEAVGGSVPRFASMMTETAQRLGMNDTEYRNPNGLPDPRQITTARDQARLALALMKHFPQYYHYFSTPSFVYRGVFHGNHNRLMERYEGMDGIKTGYIRDSGFNLVASCQRNGKRLIGVIFGGPSAVGRDNQLAALLDNAYAEVGIGERPHAQFVNASTNAGTTTQIVSNQTEVTSMDEDITRAAAPGKPDAPAAAKQETATQSERAPPPTPPAPPPVLSQQANVLRLPKGQGAASNTAGSGVWGIQIGAYNDRASGQRATALAADTMPDLLGSAAPRVLAVDTSSGTIYRARLIGLDERAARTACTRLQAKGRPCLTLPPSSGAWGAGIAN